MGRKSNAKHHNKSEGIITELKSLTDNVLRVTTNATPAGVKLLWDDHKTIFGIIEKIRKLEENNVFPKTKREDHFKSFLDWIKTEGVRTDAFSIGYFNDESYGIRAETDINEGDLWLRIPRSAMLTSEYFTKTSLSDILSQDPITKHFPQVTLALLILHERLQAKSKFKPYLDILPSEYNTVLYFNLEEFEELKGSSCFEEVLKFYRNVTRQYAYYWQMFKNLKDKSFVLAKQFTFEAYRWAVTTVCTRQNSIPSSDGYRSIQALVPLWDMCNHSQGRIFTDFNVKGGELLCYADRNFSKGDQLTISYGERPNYELFMYNGFVYPNNPCDKVALKLGISKNDALMSQKVAILQNIGINQTEQFYIFNTTNPISDKLLAFIRVFVMQANILEKWVENQSEQSQLLQAESPLDSSDEEKAWQFLKIRLELLLKLYTTSIEEDEALLKVAIKPKSAKALLAIEMRLSEKRILAKALEYISAREKTQH